MSEGGAERKGDTDYEAGPRLWDVSTEPNTGPKPMNHEIMTWAKSNLSSTDWATQAPWKFFFIKTFIWLENLISQNNPACVVLIYMKVVPHIQNNFYELFLNTGLHLIFSNSQHETQITSWIKKISTSIQKKNLGFFNGIFFTYPLKKKKFNKFSPLTFPTCFVMTAQSRVYHHTHVDVWRNTYCYVNSLLFQWV